jgi:ADP-heptose:LPS heptosyltransferase
VLSLPALAALRRRFGDATLTVMTGKIPGQVVELAGVADEVIAIDRVELRDGPKLRSISGIFKIAADIRRRRFDLVIDLHSLPETNILALVSGAGHRLLANRASRSLDLLSNFRPKPPVEDRSKHLTGRYLDVLTPLGIVTDEDNFLFKHRERDADVADVLLSHIEKPVIGLFPGAGHPSRCWPLESFAKLAQRLIGECYGTVVFLGPEEAGMREQIERVFPVKTPILEGLSIPEFIACAARLEAFVTNDTGPMHLAACAGAPVVLILDGPAPLTYLPLTKTIKIIQQAAIADIAPDEVFQAVEDIVVRSDVGLK